MVDHIVEEMTAELEESVAEEEEVGKSLLAGERFVAEEEDNVPEPVGRTKEEAHIAAGLNLHISECNSSMLAIVIPPFPPGGAGNCQ